MPDANDGFEELEHQFFAAGEALEPEPEVTSQQLCAWLGSEPPASKVARAPGPGHSRAARFVKLAALWALCVAPATARWFGRRCVRLGQGLLRAVFAAAEGLTALGRAAWRALQATAARRLSPRRLAAMIQRGEWLPMPWLPLARERPWLAIAALALLISTVGSVWAAAVLAATSLVSR